MAATMPSRVWPFSRADISSYFAMGLTTQAAPKARNSFSAATMAKIGSFCKIGPSLCMGIPGIRWIIGTAIFSIWAMNYDFTRFPRPSMHRANLTQENRNRLFRSHAMEPPGTSQSLSAKGPFSGNRFSMTHNYGAPAIDGCHIRDRWLRNFITHLTGSLGNSTLPSQKAMKRHWFPRHLACAVLFEPTKRQIIWKSGNLRAI